jgi:adenylate kinase family enzyme
VGEGLAAGDAAGQRLPGAGAEHLSPPDPATLPRLVVIGSSGSGKSTLARLLAVTLHTTHVQLDALHWGPGWQPRPKQAFLDDVEAATRGEHWIVDGNYRATRDIVWPRATAIVWLDYGFATVFSRVFARTIARSVTRETLYAGNRESLWRAFTSRDSILLWVITSYRRYRREYRALMSGGAYPHLVWFALPRPVECARFVAAARTTT